MAMMKDDSGLFKKRLNYWDLQNPTNFFFSGCDRRERTVRSVLNGPSVLFYPNHFCLSSIEATKIKKSSSPAQGRMKAVDALIPTMAPSWKARDLKNLQNLNKIREMRMFALMPFACMQRFESNNQNLLCLHFTYASIKKLIGDRTHIPQNITPWGCENSISK